jgi:hypothetical protein
VPAGQPKEAVEVNDEDWPLPVELVGNGDLYLLQVRGDSMIDAAVLDGDWVAVRKQPNADNGEIVVAMIDNEVTVKTLRRVKGRILLMPQNPVYQPIPADKAVILGKVVAVLRRLLQVTRASDPSLVSVVLLSGNHGPFRRGLQRRVRHCTWKFVNVRTDCHSDSHSTAVFGWLHLVRSLDA